VGKKKANDAGYINHSFVTTVSQNKMRDFSVEAFKGLEVL